MRLMGRNVLSFGMSMVEKVSNIQSNAVTSLIALIRTNLDRGLSTPSNAVMALITKPGKVQIRMINNMLVSLDPGMDA